MRRSGGPLGLSIIGGNDHSCVPFGTGEQVRNVTAYSRLEDGDLFLLCSENIYEYCLLL